MSDKPSAERIADIHKNFDYFDDDNNGSIELKEFIRLLKIIEPSSTLQQAEEGFAIIDDDNNGMIDFDEFISWWESYWWQY